jgi:hypothetical protein
MRGRPTSPAAPISQIKKIRTQFPALLLGNPNRRISELWKTKNSREERSNIALASHRVSVPSGDVILKEMLAAGLNPGCLAMNRRIRSAISSVFSSSAK